MFRFSAYFPRIMKLTVIAQHTCKLTNQRSCPDSFQFSSLQPLWFYRFLGDSGAVNRGREKSKRERKKFGRRKVEKESKSSFLTFLRPNFFRPLLDFFPPSLTAPGSPRMVLPLFLASFLR